MQLLCHWCNRAINSDELIIAIVARRPEGDTSSYGLPDQGPFLEEQPWEEQPWHTVCFGVVQGAPADD